LKAQNIYIKTLLKPYNTYNKPCFETAYIDENEINLLKHEVAQRFAISLGYFTVSKTIMSLKNVAQLAKNCLIWSHWRKFTLNLNNLEIYFLHYSQMAQ
jgi:hypothetical protein